MPEKFPASGFGEVREQQAPDALTELGTPVADALLHLRIAIQYRYTIWMAVISSL